MIVEFAWRLKLVLLISIGNIGLNAQSINPSEIQIARDSFGVPHIFAESNNEVAYGMAWVQCEDQFKTLQEVLAACRGSLGEINGKDGVMADIGIQFMGIADFVDSQYEEDVQGDFREYTEAYVAGVNAYAAKHPDEILLKKLFPVSGQDVIIGYLLGSVEISGAGRDLQKILSGRIKRDIPVETDSVNTTLSLDEASFPKGSNAFAFSSSLTQDGKTYLAINSHQPLEGWYSWYEAHLHSEEGLNIIGGTFAGGVSIFLGANEHLGWAHTVNYADFSDVYKLTVNAEGTAYLMDGKWKPLVKKKARARLKALGFLKIPVSRNYYLSDYGPTFKTDDGYFAWRFMAGQTLKMAEQWWRMNLAQDLEAFQKALRMRGIVSTNIVYADRADNIYYISNGRLPKRDSDYEWGKVLPGNTKKTLTEADMLVPFDSLPQVLNPASGWIFNTNNTPFTASSSGFSPVETELNAEMGFQESGDENNRSMRFLELMEGRKDISYEDFKKIKYDNQYPKTFQKVWGINANVLFEMDPTEYPDVADQLSAIQEWDRRMDVGSTGATAFLATVYAMNEHKSRKLRGEELALKGLKEGKKFLNKHFKKRAVPLGELQRHTRGGVNLPIAGGPDVLAAMYSRAEKDGTYRAVGGESYIELVRFSEDGVEVESINAFGNSEVQGHPRSISQMKYFATQRLKKMSFSKEEVLREAVEVYSPE